MEILNHRLPVPFKDSPNHGGFITAPSLIVIHYTGGRSAQNAVAALCNPHPPEGESRRSAHLVIGVDGKISQLVPFNREAWHAGESSWKGQEHCNKFSIGIELVNPGWQCAGWQDGIIHAAHKNGGPVKDWALFNVKQIAACFTVCTALTDRYPSLKEVVGHEDIAPTRKQDPGPAFPMDKFRAWLFGG